MKTGNDPLHCSLYIFFKCQATISRIGKYVHGQLVRKEMGDEVLLMALINHLILETTSFLDEYHKKFIGHDTPEIDQRIKDIKSICKPIWKKINQWKDISKYRNEIIAHPWYDNHGQFTLPGLPKYNIPRNWVEIIILGHYIQYLYTMIYHEFNVEIEEARKLIHDDFETTNPAPQKYESLNQETIELAHEVHALCQKHGKTYLLRVQQYNFEK